LCLTTWIVVFAFLLWQVLERQQLEVQANAVDQTRLQLHAQQQSVLGEAQQLGPNLPDSTVATGQQQLGVEPLAQQLEQSQRELRAALAAAAEAQQEARQLRRQVARCAAGCSQLIKEELAACYTLCCCGERFVVSSSAAPMMPAGNLSRARQRLRHRLPRQLAGHRPMAVLLPQAGRPSLLLRTRT
jgi:hypothetical protein